VIILLVVNELSYDHIHRNRKRIFRVNTYYDEFKTAQAGTPFVLADALRDDFPQVKTLSPRFIDDRNAIVLSRSLAG
jgi:hypothetical protein